MIKLCGFTAEDEYMVPLPLSVVFVVSVSLLSVVLTHILNVPSIFSDYPV
jgi:hypothetical protein